MKTRTHPLSPAAMYADGGDEYYGALLELLADVLAELAYHRAHDVYDADTSMAARLLASATNVPEVALPSLLVRASDVAVLLQVSTETVYMMLRAGELPAIHMGRSVRVSRRALEDWIVKQEGRAASVRAPAPPPVQRGRPR